MKVLVTGGAGYIGSHTTLTLAKRGFQVCVLDNLSNGSLEAIQRVKKITNASIDFINSDLCDFQKLNNIFQEGKFEAVLHFAGLKSVGESIIKPIEYYENNVCGTLNLVKAMKNANVHKLVFSSSANVYGEPAEIPVSENCPTGNLTNPYGRSKLMIEEILKDLAKSEPCWRIALLRYFNPIGAHESGLIGEDPEGIPNNLAPFISQVASGRLKCLNIYGNDYSTHDGTGVRDYIHVMDLAEGHLCALNALEKLTGTQTWNLGTGRGYSVLEMVKAFEKVCGKKIPYIIRPRRNGDLAISYSDPKKAEHELNWKATRNLENMIEDAWRWQCLNPEGFKK